MKDRIRIKDIADKAGVSPGTVDRVIHKRGNVSLKAKEKVLAALDSLDYSPNILASALAYNRKWKIAALIPSGQDDPFWEQPKAGILNALKVVKDYGLVVEFHHFAENNVKQFKEYAKKIINGDYNCVIVTPIFTEQSIEFLDQCEEMGIFYVEINTCLQPDAKNLLCYIGQDSYHSGNLGARLLAFGLSSGEKAMICHMEEMVYDSQHLVDKERGFKDYFKEHESLKIEVVTAQYAQPYNEDGLSEFFECFLLENPEVKGIFVTTSRAFHVVKALRKLCREDLKLVGFDLVEENLRFLESEDIDFLINQNPFKQGYLALINIFNFLIRKIEPTRLQYLALDLVIKENANYYIDQQFEDMPIVL